VVAGPRPYRAEVVDPQLAARISQLLGDYLDDTDDTDDADSTGLDVTAQPVAIRSGTALVLVRLIDADPPVLRIYSPLLRRVERDDGLLAELNEINGHLSFLRVFWRDGTVFAATELLAESVDAGALGHACDSVSDLADYYDERLHARFGGDLAYG
jgi:Putative bacterial sensory transduction regulator